MRLRHRKTGVPPARTLVGGQPFSPGGGGHVLALVEGGERGRTSGVREQIHKAHTGDKGRSKLRSQGCVRRSLLSGI